MNQLFKVVCVAASGLFLSGCCTSRECQLEHVAKDWCMTIRACQVIPVYPLTEDIQPGDIFLVQVPIDKQQQVYEDKGFLPLDNHLARLNPGGYTNFYQNSFFAEANEALLPRNWMRPDSENVHYWESAPHAAFPGYSFSVRRGAGMNLAVPVQGVPVGLSLLGSDAADGSVTIKNACTMGLDIISLYGEVVAWAHANSNFLNNFGAGPKDKETNYLRIVSRIYLTGQMDVNLRDASTQSGGVDVGAAKPVNLLFPQLPQNRSNVTAVVAENYTNGLSILNDLLQKVSSAAGNMAPGGSLRVTAASSRNITLSEPFDPPLVFGYLGFDCPILKHGKLGGPIPTYAVLQRKLPVHHARVEDYNSQEKAQIAAYDAISAQYKGATPERQRKIRELARTVNLSAEGEGEAWLTALGLLVDGTDAAKTEQFTKLENLANAQKK